MQKEGLKSAFLIIPVMTAHRNISGKVDGKMANISGGEWGDEIQTKWQCNGKWGCPSNEIGGRCKHDFSPPV